MELLFLPFVQCFVSLSLILFNYSIPLFEIPLFVFIVLPLIFKILLIPVSSSRSNLNSSGSGVLTYVKSRIQSHSDSSKKGGG